MSAWTLSLRVLAVATITLFGLGRGAVVLAQPGSDSTRLLTQSAVIMPYFVGFSNDGRHLVTSHATDEGELVSTRIWEMASGLEVRRRNDFCTVLGADRRRCLSIGLDGVVRQISIPTGSELARLTLNEGERAMTMSADNRLLAMLQRDGTVRIIEIGTGSEIQRISTLDDDRPMSLSFSQDGAFLVGLSYEGDIVSWRVTTGKVSTRFERRDRVSRMTVSPDGELVAGGSAVVLAPGEGVGGAVYLWNIGTGAVISRLNSGAEPATLAFSPDGRRLASAGRDNILRIWNIATGAEVARFATDSYTPAIGFSPDGSLIAAGASSRSISGDVVRVWSLTTRQEVQRFTGRALPAVSGSFAADVPKLVTSGNIVRLWDLASGSEIRRFGDGTLAAGIAVVSPDGRYVAAAGQGGVRLWEAATGRELYRVDTEGRQPSNAIVFSSNGELLAHGDDRGRLSIVAVPQGSKVARLEAGNDLTGLAFALDDRYLLVGSYDGAHLLDVRTGAEIHRVYPERGTTGTAVAVSRDGRIGLVSPRGGSVVLWDLQSGRELKRFEHRELVNGLGFAPDGQSALIYERRTGSTRLVNVETGDTLGRFAGVVWSGTPFTSDGRFLVTQAIDGASRIWEVASEREIARLVSFDEGWAVVDLEGRFDASNGGDVEGLHWVVDLQPIVLSQLKERYYDPGLLAKKLGLNAEPVRDVAGFDEPTLFPEVQARLVKDALRLRIALKNRGGGIGRVAVSINGKEITADARNPGSDPTVDSMEVDLDLAGHPYLLPGKTNEVEIHAQNAEGYLSSRGVRVVFDAASSGEAPLPTLWSVVVGISDYEGGALDLQYASKDARDMARALELGARRLFGTERVHLRLLASPPEGREGSTTKDNLERAFAELETARSSDILLVYLAGHGIALGDEYYFLTEEARSAELIDPAIRERVAVGSAELVKWLKRSPALKQVMVLDTCAAGRAAGSLIDRRDVSSDQIRAIERLKDRTGFHVLMGSAADAVSYEATQYEQGLLTYALLQGMRGPALGTAGMLDVSRWFQYAADEVPMLARHIGGIQRPRIAAPEGTSFDVGQLLEEDQRQIPLASSKPLVLQPVFLSADEGFDQLELSAKVRLELRERSAAASRDGQRLPVVYLSADQLAGAIRPTGNYSVHNGLVSLRVALVRDGQKVGEIGVEGNVEDLDSFVASVAERIVGSASGL